MLPLKLAVLGSVQVTLADQAVEVKPRKALALFIYLACTGHPQERDTLATLLWPNSSQKKARSALRSRLYELRSVLGEAWFEAEGASLSLSSQAEVWLDLHPFQQALTLYQSHNHTVDNLCPDCITNLTEAVGLYRDDFLRGFTLPDCPEFDEWQFFLAESLRQSLMTMLETLIAWHQDQAEFEPAIDYARRRLALDNLHEPAHRQLMTLYAQANQQAAAWRQFETCQRLLHDELDVEPEAETQALAAAIREKRFPGTPAAAVIKPPQTIPQVSQPQPLPFKERPIFVARQSALAELDTALTLSLTGQGQLRIITGEAGAGKTALSTEFSFQAHDKQADLLIAAGASDAQTGPLDLFLPFRQVLRQLIRNPATDQTPVWNTVACLALLEHGPDVVEHFIPAADLPDLLAHAQAAGWPGERSAPKQGAFGQPAVDQNKIIEQYAAVLTAIAAHNPLLLILEDLHWADAASLGLLFRLGKQLDGTRLLIVGSYRSEAVHLPGRDVETEAERPLAKMMPDLQRHLGQITIDLEALRAAEGRALVDGLLDSEPNHLNDSFREALHHQTGSHPLFVVELLQELKKTGDLIQDSAGSWVVGTRLDWQALPARVEGAIAGRIAHLRTEERRWLTIASISGEQFLAEVVAQVAGTEPRPLIEALSGDLQTQHRLVTAESVERLGEQRLTRYRFRHNLIRVYLYEQLDEVQRTYLHEDVASALEALYDEEVEQIALALARHYQAAGVTQKTVDYLILAGEQAMRLSAYDEAAQQFNQALTLLPELPEGNERDQQEYAIQFNLGWIWEVSEGYNSEQADLAYTRTLALAYQLRDSQKIVQALQVLIRYTRGGAEFDRAQTYGEACLRLAEEIQDSQLLMRVNQSMQQIAIGLGRHGDAVAYSEQVISLYRTHQPTLSFDEVVNLTASLSSAVLSLIPVGYPERAIQRGQEALTLAQQHENPLATMYAMGHIANGHIYCRDWQTGLHWGEAMRSFSESHNLPLGVSFSLRHRAVALAMLGEVDEGLALWQKAEKKLPDFIELSLWNTFR